MERRPPALVARPGAVPYHTAMYAMVETVLFVFGLVALGYLAGLTRYLKPEVGEAMTDFASRVAMPLLLFNTMLTADFHGAVPWALWATYFTAIAVAWTAGHLAVTRLFGRDARAGVAGGVGASFSNLLLLGIPLILGVYGAQGLEILSLVIVVHLPVMILASVVLFNMFDTREVKVGIVRSFFDKTSRNPLIIAIAIGLVWRVAGIPLPALGGRLVGALAGSAGTVALFAMGLSLRRFGISGNIRPAMVLTALKLFVMPAVALGMALTLGMTPLAASVAVTAAALPAGVNAYLIAAQFGTGQALATNQMTLATALSLLTLTLWLIALQAIYG